MMRIEKSLSKARKVLGKYRRSMAKQARMNLMEVDLLTQQSQAVTPLAQKA